MESEGRYFINEKRNFTAMHWFYCPHITRPECILDPEESRHCCSVLRLAKGDAIHLVDGKGGYYQAVIMYANSKATRVMITQAVSNNGKRFYRVHIAIAPPKNPERFEWFVEKATEIGIDEITPLLCKRSERHSVKTNRLEKIMIATLKQSKQAWLPALHPLQPFPSFLKEIAGDNVFIASQDADHTLAERYTKGTDAVILVGPEGDFTEEELAMAMSRGVQPVNMGSSVLRTETAGLVACHTIAVLNLPTRQ
jgi:16S rRNA (uracil1498-N3)-methyltransferase